jgi:two-component system, chemotaxis family, response regulator Rcp1
MAVSVQMQSRTAEILLVEDNEDDVILTREGFKHAKFLVNMSHVENGEECMEFLRKQGRYTDAPTPDIILLDLNMPRMDGRAVLKEITRDETLQQLPVVVLTTSDAERDVLDMYRLRCSAYITKPIDFEKFREVVRKICDYWFTLVVLPPNETR